MTSMVAFAAGKVVSAVSAVGAFYTELNPSTLSGAIDVVVVQQDNGDLVCSPFHVRFGKLKVLRPHEKKVQVTVNGEQTDLQMKVGEAGEAFFVVETENDVPSEYATSPIQQAAADDLNIEPLDLGEAADIDGENANGYVSAHGSEIAEDEFPSDTSSPIHGPPNGHDFDHPPPPASTASQTPNDLPVDAQDVAESYKQDAAMMGIETDGPPDGDVEPTSPEPEPLHRHHHRHKRENHNTREIPHENDEERPHSALGNGQSDLGNGESEIGVNHNENGMDFSQGIAESLHSESQAVEPTPPVRSASLAKVPGLLHPKSSSEGGHEDKVQQREAGNEGTGEQIEVERTTVEEIKITETMSKDELPTSTMVVSSGQTVVERPLTETPVGDLDRANIEEIESIPTAAGASASRVELEPKADIAVVSDNTSKPQLNGKINELVKDKVNETPVRPLPTRYETDLYVGKGKNRNMHARSSSVNWDDMDEMPFSEDEFDPYNRRTPKPIAKPPTKSGPLSDNGVEYADYAHKHEPDTTRKGWTWGWGTLPRKQGEDRHRVSRPETTMSVDEKVGNYLAGLPERTSTENGMVVAEGREQRQGSPDPSGDLAVRKASPEPATLPEGDNSMISEAALNVTFNADTTIEMSLCGYKDLKSVPMEAAEENFKKHEVTFEKFCSSPSLLSDPNLIVRINGNYYSWAVAAPIIMSNLSFGKALPEEALGRLLKQQILQGRTHPDVSRRYSFGHLRSWWSRSSTTKTTSVAADGKVNVETDIKTETKETAVVNKPKEVTPPPPSPSEKPQQVHKHKTNYAKSLRLTSEQLKALNLKKGANNVTFSVASGFQGTAVCQAKLFLWDIDDKVVISDIDGTITKSDVVGHIYTMIGRDWTHSGVASLYTNVSKNGYKFLYLTARAIGQASATRDYLVGVQQGQYQLPEGPVIMSPDRLLKSFHREVILRKPEEFKIACLRDIKRLFADRTPFYAGFGNRITDALSYRNVDVPASRIFSIDPTGEVKLELLANYKSSYIKLNDIVDQIFPPITDPATTPEYNDFNFWRPTFPEITFDVEPAGHLPEAEDEDDIDDSLMDSDDDFLDEEDEEEEEEEEEEFAEAGQAPAEEAAAATADTPANGDAGEGKEDKGGEEVASEAVGEAKED
ncbi:Lipin-3 [Borealophlyctis nickersoniae]|nr:Lipin-3 [Borealophlyctis nickersoniae]